MFIADDFVFIDLPKTGSSHMYRLLSHLARGGRSGTHVRATPALLGSGRAFWGTVRNPWDWYVSLWAYGCDGKGSLHHCLTSDLGWLRHRGWKTAPLAALGACFANPRRRRAEWVRSYKDVTDPGCFRAWLSMLHDPVCAVDIGQHYAAHRLSGFAGLMTFRYLALYCTGDASILDSNAVLDDFERKQLYITQFIRTDHLEQDLEAAFAAIGQPLSQAERDRVSLTPPTNPSSRRLALADYYDASSLVRVAERDRLIVQKFGFEPPLR